MEQTANPISFDEWAASVDELCRRHLVCSWKDLCGDLDPLERSYEMGDTPLTFVEWWAEKYDLHWVDPTNQWDAWN